MPTPQQRGVAILDAVLNASSTPAQRQRAVTAFGSADNFVREIRQFLISRIMQHEEAAGRVAARNLVDTDFTELP